MVLIAPRHENVCAVHPAASFDVVYCGATACWDCIEEHLDQQQALFAGRDPALGLPCECPTCGRNMGRCDLCGAWTRRVSPLRGNLTEPRLFGEPGFVCVFCALSPAEASVA